MLHDHMLNNAASENTTDERRSEPRSPTDGEITVRWHLDPQTSMRYELVEFSDSGARIRCGMALPTGATCTVLKLLPEGRDIRQPAMVQWVGEPDENAVREIGLWFF